MKEKKRTSSVPGSERYERARNGRLMLKAQACEMRKLWNNNKQICKRESQNSFKLNVTPDIHAPPFDTDAAYLAEIYKK